MIYVGIGLAIISLILFIKIKGKKSKLLLGIIFSSILVFISIVSLKPLFFKMNYGLDLQGGFEVLYEVKPLEEDQELTSDMVYNTYKAILKRIDILGVSEPEITIEGDNHIRIGLAGVKNIEEARNTISSTAVLSFRDSSDNLLMTSSVLGGNAKVTTDQYGKPAVSLSIKDKDTFYEVTNKVKDMTNNVIVIWLDYDENEDSYLKEKNNCGSLSDSKCLSAARVDRAFASDVIIQGNFSEKEAQNLVELINSGALPTKLDEISSRTVEASYGMKSLEATIISGIIGLVLVCIVMIWVYHFSGIIASVCISLYTVLSFLIFYLIGGVLTLPGIAAMLLGIGMAVDASVLCFERIKEQLKRGVSLKEAYDIGNKESFSSIIDANLTTIIVAIILFILGQSSVKGFATMLIINIIVTVVIMVFFSRYILKKFVETKAFNNKLNLFIGVRKKQIIKSDDVHIPFKKVEIYKKRKLLFAIPLVIIMGSIIGIIFTGFNFGVDFTGGTNITININDKFNENEFKDSILVDYTLKKEDKNDKNYTYVIDEVLTKDEISALNNKIVNSYDVNTDIFVVSQIVKQELTKNALLSLLIAAIGIIIYISIRFKFNYAISGVIALIHDVIMTILFFGLFNIEITSIFIAAILTIIGYSINATIVTFDMIRDLYNNKFKNKKPSNKELENVVDDAVRLTLFRSILTTLTTILPVISLMIFGAKEILNFNIALLLGFIFGLYSSVFISNQIWLYLEKKSINAPKKKDDDKELEELKVKGINC